MAGAALNLFEKVLTLPGVGRRRQNRVTRRNPGATNELRKVVNIRQPQVIRLILRISRRLTHRGDIGRPQTVGDTHFVQVSVTDKREQTAVLIFPAKPADPGLPWRLEHGHLNGFPLNLAVALLWLPVGDRNQRVVINGFNKTISQRVVHCAQSADAFICGYVLLGLCTDGAVIDNRTAGNAVLTVVDQHRGVHEIAIRVLVPNPDLSNLARTPGHRILMTIAARGCVVYRAQASCDVFPFFEVLLVEGKGITGGFHYSIADALGGRKAWSIESGWGFCCGLLCDSRNSNCQKRKEAEEKVRHSGCHEEISSILSVRTSRAGM